MKKLFLILLIFPISIYSQEVQQNVQVNIKERGQTYSDVVAARAAESAAMTDSSKDIKVPLEVDLYQFTHIAIVDATFANDAGRQGASRSSYKSTAKTFSNSPLTIINPFEYDKKKFKKDKKFLRGIKNPNWLYVYYVKSKQGVNDIRSLVVRKSDNRIIYNITTTNIPMDETVSALINF